MREALLRASPPNIGQILPSSSHGGCFGGAGSAVACLAGRAPDGVGQPPEKVPAGPAGPAPLAWPAQLAVLTEHELDVQRRHVGDEPFSDPSNLAARVVTRDRSSGRPWRGWFCCWLAVLLRLAC